MNPGQKLRHKFITPGQADTPQLPNEFTVFGTDKEGRVGLLQTGQIEPSPTWWPEKELLENFEPWDAQS